MELPSMVQRSGDTLIVRSVVSGNQLYMDHSVGGNAQNAGSGSHHNVSSTSALEQQLERYRVAAQQQQQYQHQLQQHQQQQQQQQQQQTSAQQLAAMELKDEGLPQCKIKRNYSCSYCTYFTQNPRYHLTHLRDVHGEKIVINKCKLCLYASRHFQKLVRHMKMVHGCTEGIPGQHGQTRKRGMNREARKRKLEQSAVEACGGSTLSGTANQLVDLGSLEQVKRELQLQDQQLRRDVLAFGKQQQDEKQRQQQQQQQQQHQLDQSTAEAIFVAAYERQLQAQRERELEVLQQQEMSNTPTLTSTNFQVPQQQQQQQQISNKSLDVVTPSASMSPPTPALTITPASFPHDNEPAQNRLLKCSVCDFTTLYRAQLVDHELEEHCKTKFFRCEKCSYVTHIKARFSKHVKYHSMPMIKCVTCDFRTPYKWNLDRHMKNHGGAGPFKCAACDFTADIKQSLTVHEMNHHVPPVGHAAGMSLARRRNKVGGTDLSDDFLSDSAELLEDHFNNNNLDDYEEALAEAEAYGKRGKYEEDEPTDLSHKGGSSDTSSVHNQSLNGGTVTPKSKRPVPNLIPIPKMGSSVLNLSKDLAASRSSLTDIASMFFNEKQLSEMLQPLDKSDAAQLSPTTTITSTSSQHSRSLLQKKLQPGGSFFDKLKLSALTPGGPSENLICPCGHVAKYLSESIIHRKSCNFAAITTDDDIEEEEEPDDVDGRLEIDFDDDDKQSHSALNLSVTGSTRCQHCRHRCKSSADLLNHLKQCSEARRCANDSYDSLSGESSSAGRIEAFSEQQQHPMENRVFVWNKMPSGSVGTTEGKTNDGQTVSGSSSTDNGGNANGPNDENSYYGVETAPGYGEVYKKMTPEEEAANSSLKKVYKCPHCSFWASTASRFHVHIVGHLNKKPFECSLCSYRSNWRWDITKHIRLKTIRDPSHKNARVLMNDETGRRNYTKYNKYITLMKVTEEDGDPKLMKSGEMTPNQVASLAFLNDYNKSTSNGVTTLNGIKDDVTLEPITTATTTTPPKSSSHTGGGGDTVDSNAMPEGFMRLPFIATAMMNAAAMAQQQEQDQQHVTLITPSVTISAVKRSPPSTTMLNKPSDDLVTDVKQEGNERKTFYKCRKCSFRHGNRDAVLAHVKIHYQDYPIVTATATSSPPKSTLQQQQQQHSTPLQVAVNSNLYMNKVFAAMCLSQQQQQQNPNSASNSGNSAASPSHAQQQQQQQQHSILSAGLLQQAIQSTSSSSPNSALSGLALALAGKSPTKGSTHSSAAAAAAAATSILEHGEQNASQNEASSSMSALSTGALQPPTYSSCPPAQQPSLQHLLTSPRGAHLRHSPIGAGNNLSNNNNNNNKNNHNNFNNNNLVMGIKSCSAAAAIAAATTTTTNATICSPSSLSNTSQSPNSSSTIATIATTTSSATTATVTTLPTANSTPTSTTSNFNHTITNSQMGLIIGGASGSSSSSSLFIAGAANNNSNSNNNHNNNNNNQNVGVGASGGICIGGVHGSNNNSFTTTTPTSCNNLLLSNTATTNATTSNTNTNIINSNNLLTNDNERRDPSPYRCGHCHQVSNWKHVIQRHCRLKHAGDIRIETLDRSSTTTNERHAAPVYRPLGNGASNESNSFGLTLKALQQQQTNSTNNQHNINNPHHNNNNSSNNNMLLSKAAVEQLMHSPHAANAANNATPQDIHAAAAAAYLAAAYKAATASATSVATGQSAVKSAEDMLLQQQLQQNEQIEITRLPSNTSNAAQINTTSSLAQLLEHSAAVASTSLHAQQNSKCKQQKCPLCPYISESKSQMNYHISLHKPTQYECTLCTFVCAKKQHLSSHMRSVHQQNANAAGAANGNISNLDFSVALQLAAAAQAQQDSKSMLQSPLAIDLSALKSLTAANCSNFLQKQQQTQQLSNEFQLFKIVSYCDKCPARFPQKLHDAVNSTEFQDHMKAHQTSSEQAPYKCEFCDFMAPHETQLQAHRFVHTGKYQEKCNELIRNCKEDPEHPAPKLLQITANKNAAPGKPEFVWVIDNELSVQLKQQQQQSSSISSSSTSLYDNTNSLLKKQLESGPAPLPMLVRNTPSPSPKAVEDLSSAAPSTSASVATSDLAADAGSESGSVSASPAPLEKCLYCPYETTNTHLYKSHLQHHECISHVKEAHSCEHCDYTDQDESHIAEHTRLHFNAMEKLKTVAFFTSYDQLELSTERSDSEATGEETQTQEQNTQQDMDDNVNNHQRIKQEHNNNNEENAVNENTLQEIKDNISSTAATTTTSVNKEEMQNNEKSVALPPPTTDSAARKSCTKIILYKNDGCLSIKKDLSVVPQLGGTSSNSSDRDNISDRLRRRISRSSTSHLNGGDDQQSQQQSHKTILVNAKTGQVISRN